MSARFSCVAQRPGPAPPPAQPRHGPATLAKMVGTGCGTDYWTSTIVYTTVPQDYTNSTTLCTILAAVLTCTQEVPNILGTMYRNTTKLYQPLYHKSAVVHGTQRVPNLLGTTYRNTTKLYQPLYHKSAVVDGTPKVPLQCGTMYCNSTILYMNVTYCV